jgi:hypothetical protein
VIAQHQSENNGRGVTEGRLWQKNDHLDGRNMTMEKVRDGKAGEGD